MINIYNQKIALISDIHLGVHTNSEVWHKIMLDYAVWLRDELITKGIKDIFVLGDIFNDRSDIGVQTLHVAEAFFKTFTDGLYNFNIVLLTGNHDSFFHDKADVNSISILKGWKNITVIDKLEFAEWYNKKYAFVPWGVDINTLPENLSGIFGHFEINTFKINNNKICEHGIDSDLLLSKSPNIYSGHYHTPQARKYPNGKILYLGCPYALRWSDVDETKGYYILDIKNDDIDFFENTISPKYYKIKLSDLMDKDKRPDLKKKITGNFIKIIVDKKLDYEMFEKLQTSLNALKPMDLGSDFSERSTIETPETYEAVNMDIPVLIPEYVDLLDKPDLRDKIVAEMDDIYNTALTKVKIESN